MGTCRAPEPDRPPGRRSQNRGLPDPPGPGSQRRPRHPESGPECARLPLQTRPPTATRPADQRHPCHAQTDRPCGAEPGGGRTYPRLPEGHSPPGGDAALRQWVAHLRGRAAARTGVRWTCPGRRSAARVLKAGMRRCTWGPDGQWIAFNLEGRLRQVLGRGFERVTQPAWSPNGGWVAYAARAALRHLHRAGRALKGFASPSGASYSLARRTGASLPGLRPKTPPACRLPSLRRKNEG